MEFGIKPTLKRNRRRLCFAAGVLDELLHARGAKFYSRSAYGEAD